jgi:hypothetical protein
MSAVPGIKLESRWPWAISVVGSALITGAAGVGGAYLDHERRPPVVQVASPEPSPSASAEYMLWSPSALNPKSKDVVVFKLDTRSGKTWLLHTGAHWTQPNWAPVKDPSAP